jgi:hypothetical protein
MTTAEETLRSKGLRTRNSLQKCRQATNACEEIWSSVMLLQQLQQQLRSTESLAETLQHENEQVGTTADKCNFAATSAPLLSSATLLQRHWLLQRRTALEQQSARIGLLVQHLEEADSAMKARKLL